MLTSEVAGGIILNGNGEIVLVKNGPDFWGFPKGHLDAGEDTITAARREIREETGLTNIAFVKSFGSYERHKSTSDGKDDESELKSIHMFLFTSDEEKLAPEDASNPEAKWIPIGDVTGVLTHRKDREFFEGIKDSLK